MVVSVFQLKEEEEEEEELTLDAATLGSPGLHPPLPVSESSSSLGGAVLEGSRGVPLGADLGCVELNGGPSVETGQSGRGVLEMEGGLVLLGSVKQEEGEREGGEAALMTEEEEEEERGASQQSLSLPVEHLDRAEPLPGLEQMEAGTPLTERDPHAPAERELRPGSGPGAGSGGDPGAGGASGGSSPRGQESRAGRAGARRELRRGPGSKGSREEEEEGERQRGREADCADGGSDRDAGQAERPQRRSGVCVTEASRETGGLSSRRKKPPLKCQQEELLDSLARSSEVEEDSDRSDSEVEGEAAVLARYSPAGDPSEEEEEEEEEEEQQHANDAEPAAHQWKKTSAQSALLFQDQGDPSLPPLRSAPLSPSQYFRQYFSWELWESVAQQSSSRQAGGAAGRVSARDVCVFIGANIVMGTLRLPSLKLYWSASTRIPMISERISRERFSALGSTLRVSGGEGEAGGRLWRVGPALESVRRACRRLPRETVCTVTERAVPLTQKHRGGGGAALRVSLLLGGASGLVLDLQLGGGPLSRADAVAQLAETIPGDGGHVLLLPRAAPRTMELLLRGGVRSSGAVEGGSLGGLAGELLGAGGGEREAVVRSDGRVALVRCRGRVFASTCLAGEPPGGGRGAAEAMARERRLFEETVGRQGALGELYGAPSPWRRWGVTVLLYLVDLALLNSWLEYRQDGGSRRGISLMAFRMQVAEGLLRSGAKPESRARKRPGSEGGEEEEEGGVEMKRPALSLPLPPSPAAELRYDGADHWPEQLERAGGCGFESCSRTTSVSCIKCRVFLCIATRDNCFLKFHKK